MGSQHSRETAAETGSNEQDVSDSEDATVLIVDDEPRLLDLYEAMLEDRFTVETATSGAEAIDALSEAIDAVILDRRMPVMSGDEVLERIRSGGYECHVGMVTAVEPNLDILDMEFDAYLIKPVLKEDLRELVDGLLTRQRYSEAVNELLSLSSRLVRLEQNYSENELAADESYQKLRARKAELEATTRAELEKLANRNEVEFVYRDVLAEATGGEHGD